MTVRSAVREVVAALTGSTEARPGGKPETSRSKLGAAEAALATASLRPTDVVALDEAIRRRLRWGQPPDVTTASWAAAALLTCHPSGFVREAALLRVGEVPDDRALPFVVLRLTDWVPEVRATARRVVGVWFASERAGALVRSLPLVDALSSRSRAAALADVLEELRRPEHRAALVSGLDDADRAVRRAVHRLLEEVEPGRWIARACADRDLGVRAWALKRVPAGSELLETALADPTVTLRREALARVVAERPDRAGDALADALFDPSAAVRWDARFWSSRRGPFDAAARYREAIGRSSGKRLGVALLGLGECGARTDVALVAAWLDAPEAVVRAAAVRALGQLDRGESRERLLVALGDPAPRVSRAAREALERSRSVGPVLPALVLDTSRPVHVRRNALALVALGLEWDAIPVLVRALADDDLHDAAAWHVWHWIRRYNSTFLMPSAADREALAKALRDVGNRMPPDWLCWFLALAR